MDKLKKADIYIDENRIPREKLPVFHVTPPVSYTHIDVYKRQPVY